MISIKLLEPVHSFQSNTYLISSGISYAVIDPSVPYDSSLFEGELRYILLTHAHFDHMLDIDSWVCATGAEVILSIDELPALADPLRNCYKLFDGSERGYFGAARGVKDGEALPLGDTEIKVVACPGHTVGSVSYVCDGHAFVGDTVFEGRGYGRVDLPTGDMRQLVDSIRRLLTLPDDTILLPGHGGSTTVKEYKG